MWLSNKLNIKISLAISPGYLYNFNNLVLWILSLAISPGHLEVSPLAVCHLNFVCFLSGEQASKCFLRAHIDSVDPDIGPSNLFITE